MFKLDYFIRVYIVTVLLEYIDLLVTISIAK